MLFQGNGQAFLGVPDTDTLNNINCNKIDTHGNDSADNCSRNTATHQSSRHVQHHTNMMQDADRVDKFYANTDSISKSKTNKSQWLLIKIKSLTQ